MTAPSHATALQVLPLPKVLEDIENGYLAIPRYQRKLVWRDEQRIELFRSVLSGIPIGAILQWRTKVALSTYPNLGPHPLTNPKEGDLNYYLLDGHQRLATLYGSLRPRPNAPHTYEGLGFAEDREWAIYYDLESEEFHLGARGRRSWWLPMDIVLYARKLRFFQRNLERTILEGRIEIPPDIEKKIERYYTRSDEVALAFGQYAIPIVPFLTDDIDKAIRTFEKINTQGTPMDEVHLVSALTWSNDFDFADQLKAVVAGLEECGWGELEEKLILQTCKAALGWDVTKAPPRNELQRKLRDRPSIIEQAGENIHKAISFLYACGIDGPSMLPYSIQLVLIAEACRLGFDNADNALAARLRQWLWASSFSESFAGINSTRWRRARDHVHALVRGTHDDPIPADCRAAPIRPMARFDTRAARTRALLVNLALEKPEPWPAMSSTKTDPENESYYWSPILALHGKNTVPKLLTTTQLGKGQANEGPENRIFCHPEAWRETRQKLLDKPLSISTEALESHLISPSAANLLAKGHYHEFLEQRRQAFMSFERETITALGLTWSPEDSP